MSVCERCIETDPEDPDIWAAASGEGGFPEMCDYCERVICEMDPEPWWPGQDGEYDR